MLMAGLSQAVSRPASNAASGYPANPRKRLGPAGRSGNQIAGTFASDHPRGGKLTARRLLASLFPSVGWVRDHRNPSIESMNILDIDTDVFVDPRPHRRRAGERLRASDYHAWTPDRVERFLVEQCNLSVDKRTPGAIVTYHHELFDIWDRLIANGLLSAPFTLTHVDSHADMGMGDASCEYILCDLLHKDLNDRRNPKRGDWDGLQEGNYVSFAVACGWISKINYVQHPQTRKENDRGHPDIADRLFRNSDPNCGIIQLRAFRPGSNDGFNRYWETATPVSFEPELPIAYHERDTFKGTDEFSFLFAAQSPDYTPATVDPILEVLRGFIQPI
jgi:hypothetical protein